MLKTIIIDDEKTGRELLHTMLSKFCPELEVCAAAASVEEAVQAINKHRPHLVFMDIELTDGTGFDILERVNTPDFSVIFVTAYSQYAIKAFKYSALDYLLKPVNEEELVAAVKKVHGQSHGSDLKQQLEKFMGFYQKEQVASTGKIGISSIEGYEFVEIANIIRCEADGKYTTCFLTGNKSIISSRNIKEFEDQLSSQNFFRVHQSHIINLKYIQKYHKGRGGYVVMVDNSSVPVAERKKDEFLGKLQRI